MENKIYLIASLARISDITEKQNRDLHLIASAFYTTRNIDLLQLINYDIKLNIISLYPDFADENKDSTLRLKEYNQNICEFRAGIAYFLN